MGFKSKYKGSEIENLLDKISEGGGGITIVDSVDQLDPNAELGSMASVVTAGSIQESSFRDLYQADASMLDQNTETLTAPELLSSVLSINVSVPQNVDSLVESIVSLVTRDFSMTSLNVAMMQIVPQQGVRAMTMTGGYDTLQQFVLVEYSQDTMSYTIHNDQVEAFNAVLSNGMDWCYFGNTEGGVITEEQFATIDLFISAVASIPSKAHIYLKNDNWEELYARDFEELTSNINRVETSMNAKADKMPVEYYWSSEVKPNVYTTYTINSSGSKTITLADIADPSTYNEYIIEIKCIDAPSSIAFNNADGTAATIVWANGVAPTFEVGWTYLMSIANGFGVYSIFPNS